MAAVSSPMPATSQAWNQGRVPVSASSSRDRSAAARSCTSTKPTRAPCRANWATSSAPIPVAPPVMNTVRPARLGYRAKASTADGWAGSVTASSSR